MAANENQRNLCQEVQRPAYVPLRKVDENRELESEQTKQVQPEPHVRIGTQFSFEDVPSEHYQDTQGQRNPGPNGGVTEYSPAWNKWGEVHREIPEREGDGEKEEREMDPINPDEAKSHDDGCCLHDDPSRTYPHVESHKVSRVFPGPLLESSQYVVDCEGHHAGADGAKSKMNRNMTYSDMILHK